MNVTPKPEDRVQCPGCHRSIKVNTVDGQRRIQVHQDAPGIRPGVCRSSRTTPRD